MRSTRRAGSSASWPESGPASTRGFVAVLTIELHFPDAGSLKARRKELAPVKAYLQRLGASVAEVDHHDRWQRATLVAALAAGSLRRVDEAADRLQAWLDAHLPQGAGVRRTVLSLRDLDG